MISFEPLLRTLRKKSLTMNDLEKMCGKKSNTLNKSISNGRHISTDTLELICNTLKCDINDVISYDDIAITSKHQSVDWDKLSDIINESGTAWKKISESLGRAGNYLTQTKSRNGNLSQLDIKEICSLLNCNREDFVEIQ